MACIEDYFAAAQADRVIWKDADLFTANVDYVAHQCNCVYKNGKGLYLEVVKRCPEADVYAKRWRNGKFYPDEPGTIEVSDAKGDHPFGGVISMYAQYQAGGPKPLRDTREQRMAYFRACLQAIGNLRGVQSVAFPYKIGCGLAKGDWDNDYYPMLRTFARQYRHLSVYVFRQPERDL